MHRAPRVHHALATAREVAETLRNRDLATTWRRHQSTEAKGRSRPTLSPSSLVWTLLTWEMVRRHELTPASYVRQEFARYVRLVELLAVRRCDLVPPVLGTTKEEESSLDPENELFPMQNETIRRQCDATSNMAGTVAHCRGSTSPRKARRQDVVLLLLATLTTPPENARSVCA